MKKLSTLILTLLTLKIFAANPGTKAPNFTLTNQMNQKVSLEDFRGNYVVLEWYNFGCPYVRKHYDSQNMQKTQLEALANENVVWLSITSSAPGKQGHLNDYKHAAQRLKYEKSNAQHMLNDSDGKVGQLYEAKTTPQIVIIDPSGTIQYNGAIDSIPSADKADIKKATNYVTTSMASLIKTGKAKPAKTRPYGCSVKY
ncbi:redoxin domain-containing protein [Bacteriovorax sp. DB6_IX]|uniref:redoxin domain-containing protein n=1 Tax=Bacteriovorax sp. DB6_IX TaxID=1353530 RepID=UPI00038A4AC2|nr:redoxin domain-containing protein [Bacteriovorax sp. DB6_IX]EQC52403.1 redoxin [Bacteriovorax sp. DB6_IX]